MDMPIILAHGALGNFDEVIWLSIGAIFVVMMGISWVKSHMTEFEDEESVEKEKHESHQEIDSNNTTDDHFRLD